MDFVEYARIRQESAETGFGAKQNCPSAVLCAWIVGRISIAKNASTQGDELFMFLALGDSFRHLKIGRASEYLSYGSILFIRFNFCDQHLEGTDCQSM
jgi:hypothetical protein